MTLCRGFNIYLLECLTCKSESMTGSQRLLWALMSSHAAQHMVPTWHLINAVPLHPVLSYEWTPTVDLINPRKHLFLVMFVKNTHISNAILHSSVWSGLLYWVEMNYWAPKVNKIKLQNLIGSWHTKQRKVKILFHWNAMEMIMIVVITLLLIIIIVNNNRKGVSITKNIPHARHYYGHLYMLIFKIILRSSYFNY